MDFKVQKKVLEHLNESLENFHSNNIVGIFLQGSQNYNLETINSDVDTKLIVTPSFKDICLAKKPVSTTHIRENSEHIDFKDIRLYIETFRKQNLNFLEILFTEYAWIHPIYLYQWNRLIADRENIARMNPYRAVKSMKGITLEKYHAMEHRYPSKVEIIDRYGYDGKQVSHLLRVDDYLTRYIAGETYSDCLTPTPGKRPRIMEYKLQEVPLHIAREEALEVLNHTIQIADDFCAQVEEYEDPLMRELLEDVSYHIMKTSVEMELAK